MQAKSIFVQKGDVIDELIQARNLDKHPEHFGTLIKEMSLDKFIAALPDAGLKFISLIGVNRFLNFVEAIHCQEFTKEERRYGAAATILISCVNTGSADKMRDHNPSVSSSIPVFLYKNTDLTDLLAPFFTEDEQKKIKTLVKCFNIVHPTAVTMKRDRIAMYMRDACLQFINADNAENIFKFVQAFGPYRREVLDLPFSFDVDMMTGGGVDFSAVLKSIQSPYTSSAITQWGVVKNFNRNSTQRLKALIAAN